LTSIATAVQVNRRYHFYAQRVFICGLVWGGSAFAQISLCRKLQRLERLGRNSCSGGPFPLLWGFYF
jgi:hypothetical protein